MNKGTANLRISYLGGGYDFPEFFKEQPIYILAEGLNIQVKCIIEGDSVRWELPPDLSTGLGSSAAKHLSYIRAMYPDVDKKTQIEVAVLLDRLQAGGYQDAIVAAQKGLTWIRLTDDGWTTSNFTDNLRTLDADFKPFRKLYRVPVSTARKSILTGMQCRSSSISEMQDLVQSGVDYLLNHQFHLFGVTVRKAWEIKKRWHPDITNETIYEMEKVAESAHAWGYKVCGAGGQGYMLVIGDSNCHLQMGRVYDEFKV